MKKYKIVEECSKGTGDYTVETYTDSFPQAIDLLSRCDNPIGHDRESITLFTEINGNYVKIGAIDQG